MKIDLTCPVELWHCKMPTAQEPVLAMQVYNLSDKAVSSIQVCVLCFDAAGEQCRPPGGAGAGPGRARPLRLSKWPWTRRRPWRPQDPEVLIEKVWFEDGTVWRRGASETLDFRPSPCCRACAFR